jgi:MFS family permease
MDSFRKSYYAGIFLVAASTLLLEISLTKIFSVIHYYYFAFFVISTALFGYGLSGVFLLLSKRIAKVSRQRLLFFSSLIFGLAIVGSYKLILEIPLRISELLSGGIQLLYLAEVYLLLGLPFFFSGLVIGVLLTYYPDYINKLYFTDLTGAAVGCFALLLIIPEFGGSGAVLVSAALAMSSSLMFAEKWLWNLIPLSLIAALCFLIPGAENYFSTTGKSEKRYFQESLVTGKHTYTGWSPASRIDVVRLGRTRSVIWIDGGTNQSFMMHLKKNEELTWNPSDLVWRTEEIPFGLVKNPRALIIGPGGGVEVASALRYKPRSIQAVELDPLIVKIVQNQFRDYTGQIYERPGVSLINEEGRSFIRRSTEKFDIIQQKNNSHPMAVASGALNLSETYLLTKEAFHEYLDHLEPNGFVSINRNGGARLMNLAAEVFQERGIQDYWKRMVLIKAALRSQVFLLKNGVFTDQELDYIERYSKERDEPLLYSPRMFGKTDDVFTRLMHENTRAEILKEAPFHLEAPTDDKPFMEHFFRLRTVFSSEMRGRLYQDFWKKSELVDPASQTGYYPDLSLYMILFEALLLSTVFIIYPLVRLKRTGIATKGAWHLLTYYFCLGIGFIFIEIVLIQKYILFIGYPVYAVAVIIFSLLIAAGAGSFFSNRYRENPFRILRVVVAAIVLFILAQILIMPVLFKHFLSVPFAGRMVLSILFILPAGFFMGIPFPVGLSWTSKHHSTFVPWAWGINGYATVIGSVLSVILALNFGFRVVMLIAAGIYVIAYFALRSMPEIEEKGEELVVAEHLPISQT